MISNCLVSQYFFIIHYYGLYLQGKLWIVIGHSSWFLAPWETGRCLPTLTFLYLDGSGGEGYEMKLPNMDILSWLEMTIKWGEGGGGKTAYSQTVHVRCLRWFWFNFFAKNINLHRHYLMCRKTATRPLGHTHCHWLKHVNINLVKLLHLSHFSLPYTLFEGCGALYTYHEFQDILHTRENSRKVKMKYLIHTSGPSCSTGG